MKKVQKCMIPIICEVMPINFGQESYFERIVTKNANQISERHDPYCKKMKLSIKDFLSKCNQIRSF